MSTLFQVKPEEGHGEEEDSEDTRRTPGSDSEDSEFKLIYGYCRGITRALGTPKSRFYPPKSKK